MTACHDSDLHDFDLIVIGAGLVGASLAAALAVDPCARHCRIAVIEAGPTPELFRGAQFDPRVVALSAPSRALLARAGAWSAMPPERLCPYRDMTVWDGEGTGSIHFSAADVHSEQLGWIVESAAAVHALHQQLGQLPNITLIQPAQVVGLTLAEAPSGMASLVLDNGQQLRAPLLVAADGARSRVRELAGFATREWDYGQSALVTTVRTERAHQHTAWQRFMATGPLAFLPLQGSGERPDDRYCSIVWSADTELAQTLMALDDQAFCARLGAAFEYRLGEIQHSAARLSIPLRQRHAVAYARPGIALVGDAAHSIHPLAGQGVNLGLKDVAVLVAEVGRALERGLPLSDASILRRYQRQRRADNLGMMAGMEGFKRLFGNRSLALGWLRNTGMSCLNELPPLKNALVRHAMGLKAEL